MSCDAVYNIKTLTIELMKMESYVRFEEFNNNIKKAYSFI